MRSETVIRWVIFMIAVLCRRLVNINTRWYCIHDSIPLHSRLHVEINNTDAEGHLVPSDRISFRLH